MKLGLVFAHRQTRNLLKLVAQILHTALTHLEGYLGQRELVITDQLLDFLHFDKDDILFERRSGSFRKHLAQVWIRMSQPFTEVV